MEGRIVTGAEAEGETEEFEATDMETTKAEPQEIREYW